jgi:predicted metal-binding membrane protein
MESCAPRPDTIDTPHSTQLEILLRRDRWVTIAGLSLLCLLSWWYVLDGAGTGMSTLAMTTWQFPPPRYPGGSDGWSWSYALVMLGMWWIMMVAMMIPSAAPTILLYARVHRHHQPRGHAPHTSMFLSGYLLAWLLFSLAATLLHAALERSGLVHDMLMWSSSTALSGALLLVAGAWQLTSLKHACLIQCRGPAAWLAQNWRPGASGALRMGMRHGLFCVGCCWSLMLLLFAGGVMNLVWIAGLAILVLLEKLLPRGEWVARGSGVVLVAAGCVLLFV